MGKRNRRRKPLRVKKKLRYGGKRNPWLDWLRSAKPTSARDFPGSCTARGAIGVGNVHRSANGRHYTYDYRGVIREVVRVRKGA